MTTRRLPFSLLVVCILAFTGCKGAEQPTATLKDGDIVFQDFPSRQSAAIKLATQSKYSHCGIVFIEDGRPMIWEAVQPVRITPLDEWVARDTTGHYVIMRLNGADTLLNAVVVDSMKTIGRSYIGRDYDIYFDWSDNELYCSEFVWKLYHVGLGIDLAPLRAMGDYNLSHPSVKTIMAQRWGENFPSDEPVVAPQDLFDSDLLDLVVEVKP